MEGARLGFCLDLHLALGLLWHFDHLVGVDQRGRRRLHIDVIRLCKNDMLVPSPCSLDSLLYVVIVPSVILLRAVPAEKFDGHACGLIFVAVYALGYFLVDLAGLAVVHKVLVDHLSLRQGGFCFLFLFLAVFPESK